MVSKYIGLILFVFTKNVLLRITHDADYSEVVLMILLPDIETNQKTTKACAGTMISFTHFLTLANCVDQIRKIGPSGIVFSEKSGLHVQNRNKTNLAWKYHKYYDGKIIRRDLAIVEIQDPMDFSNSSSIISVYCSSCYDICYTVGWSTLEKPYDNLKSIETFKFEKTQLQILDEKHVVGSTTDITAKFVEGENFTADLGSPLFCRQMVGKHKYIGLIGILIEKPVDGVVKFRSLRGLMTWASNWAMGAYISPDGKLTEAEVCVYTDCDTYKHSRSITERSAGFEFETNSFFKSTIFSIMIYAFLKLKYMEFYCFSSSEKIGSID